MICSTLSTANYFETAAKGYKHPKKIANWIQTEILRYLNEQKLDIDQVPDLDAEPENQDYAGLEAADLLAMIRELPPKYRMVFNLYAIEGYTHKEISEMINISEGTSKSNLSRARIILQKRVEALTGIRKQVVNE